MVRLSIAAATFASSTIEGKGQTMGFRDLAKAISLSTMEDKHKSKVKRALEKRKKELQRALAAVEHGLAALSKPAAKKRSGAKR
jgi:hypothetical protein